MIAIAPQTNQTELIRQLQGLGYGPGDRVWLRLLVPKKLPLDVALSRGLAYEKDGQTRLSPIDGYITLGGTDSFTRLWGKSGKTQTYLDGFTQLQRWNRQGYGVYFVVNPGGREDRDILEGRSLFYECDQVSKAEQWERLQRLEQKLGDPASEVVETRNSLHVYFRQVEAVEPDTWKQNQQRLIQAQDSDPAIFNPARLMRLAGFDHWKWDEDTQELEATPVNLVQENSTTFSLEQFDRVLPAWDESRWEKKRKGDRLGNGLQSFSTANFSSALGGGGVDMRELAPYLEAGPEQAEWLTFRCPNHNGVSLDSLHVRKDTGAYVCHAKCGSNADIYRAALELAKSRGFVVPHVERVPTRQPDHAFLSHLAEVDRVEQAQDNERIYERFFKMLSGKIKRKARKSRRSQAVVPVTENRRKVLVFGVDEIPVKDGWNDDAWDGVPFEVECKQGQHKELWIALQKAGWTDILDKSAPGLRKSFTAGLLQPRDFQNIGALAYVHAHKEADTPSLKEWPRLPALNDDNCHRAKSRGTAREKGVETYDEIKGVNWPCFTCSKRSLCSEKTGPGFGFNHLRRKVIRESPRVRMHPAQISPRDQEEIRRGCIIDEASSLLDGVKRLKASRPDILLFLDDLEANHPTLHAELSPVLDKVKDLMRSAPKFGWTDSEIREALGPIPENISDLLEQVGEVTPSGEDLFSERDRVVVEGMTSRERSRLRRLTSLIDLYPENLEQVTQLEQRYGVIVLANLEQEDRRVYRMWEKNFSNGKIEDLKVELSDLKRKQQEIERTRKTARQMARALNWEQTQQEREEISSLHTQWLRPFLAIWNGQQGAMRIDNGGLSLTRPNHLLREGLDSYAFRLYLDGTGNVNQIARVRNINPDEIVVCYQKSERPKNLRVIQIKDFGLMGTQRSKSLQARQNLAIANLEELHPDIAFFDRMRVNGKRTTLDGHWFNHTRGSNEFRERSAIASFGTPILNIGSLQDEFFTLTGKWGGPEFDAWLVELVQAEFIQCGGRLRARQRPNEQLFYYVFSDFPLPPELAAEQMSLIDLCPEAANPRDRSLQTVIGAMYDLMVEKAAITQQAIAERIGKTRSWVAEMCKEAWGSWKAFKAMSEADFTEIVGDIIESNNRITDMANGDFGCDEEEYSQAVEIIPSELEKIPLEEVPQLIAKIRNGREKQSWLNILALLDDKHRQRLLAGMYTLLPGCEDWLMEQLDRLQMIGGAPIEAPA